MHIHTNINYKLTRAPNLPAYASPRQLATHVNECKHTPLHSPPTLAPTRSQSPERLHALVLLFIVCAQRKHLPLSPGVTMATDERSSLRS